MKAIMSSTVKVYTETLYNRNLQLSCVYINNVDIVQKFCFCFLYYINTNYIVLNEISVKFHTESYNICTYIAAYCELKGFQCENVIVYLRSVQ